MRKQMRCAALVAVVAGILLRPETALAGTGAVNLSNFIQLHIIDQALIAFWGISAIAVFYYAVRMIVKAHNEQVYGEAVNSFVHVLVGFAVISLAGTFATAFFLSINPGAFGSALVDVIHYIIRASEGIFVLMVTIAGFRMMSTEGDEGEFHKWRKVLTNSIIGVMIMIIADLSNSLVVASLFAGGTPTTIAEEILGLIIFILTVLGFVCVVALIVAGILLIVSVDEAFRDRAKRIIIGTLISLAFLIAVYSLLNTFVPTTRG